jgi:DnaK suppressor protein
MALIWVAEPEDRRMDAKTLKYTRRRLSSQYENLIESISRSRLAAKEIYIENTEDEGDLATINHERDLRYTLHDSDYAHLRCIEEAMKDRGEYGKCVRCGEDINEKRREAVPWATMCIRCQEETEREAEHTSAGMVQAGLEAEETDL